MAKAVCCKSGIVLSITGFNKLHFDGSQRVGGVSLHHPVFDLNFESLSQPYLVNSYLNRELDEQDTILYFLALLNSSGLVTFTCPANPSIATVESNMLPLLYMLEWKAKHSHRRISLPTVVITEETAKLPTVKYWIKAWIQAKADYEDGYVAMSKAQLLLCKEDTLERLIKTQATDVSKYAGILADWAVLACDPPQYTRDYEGNKVETAQYWRTLILTCAKSESHIWRLPIEDLQDMLTHMEDYMDAGTIYGYAVLKLIREGIETHKNYLGFTMLGDTSNNSGTAPLVQNDVEYAYSKILASDAPLTEPKLTEYPNKIAYLQAKIRWQQANKLVSNVSTAIMAATVAPVNNTINTNNAGEL